MAKVELRYGRLMALGRSAVRAIAGIRLADW